MFKFIHHSLKYFVTPYTDGDDNEGQKKQARIIFQRKCSMVLNIDHLNSECFPKYLNL